MNVIGQPIHQSTKLTDIQLCIARREGKDLEGNSHNSIEPWKFPSPCVTLLGSYSVLLGGKTKMAE
jgi:hypothetical protein